jgi:hypothetical protein
MVDAAKFFQSKGTYLNASHVSAGDLDVAISEVQVETIGRNAEQKLVLYFAGLPRGLAINKTNYETLFDAFGPETDGWIGGKITLYPVETEYDGKKVDGIRLRVDPANRIPRDKWLKPKPGPTDEMNDTIPF